MTKTALKLIEISKIFGNKDQKTTALNKINLELKKGEIAALIGPSGSGKTTLLQIAGLLSSPTSGQIFINDQDMSSANDTTRTKIRKENIGFIYQFHHLLPEFSALENVALPLLIQGQNPKTAKQKATDLLTSLNLADRLTHNPNELSGGQQQRVAIARAIITKPSLILADEPTGNLDSKNSENIFNTLKNLAKQHQIACLIVTHNTELAKTLPKQIEINDGKIEN